MPETGYDNSIARNNDRTSLAAHLSFAVVACEGQYILRMTSLPSWSSRSAITNMSIFGWILVLHLGHAAAQQSNATTTGAGELPQVGGGTQQASAWRMQTERPTFNVTPTADNPFVCSYYTLTTSCSGCGTASADACNIADCSDCYPFHNSFCDDIDRFTKYEGIISCSANANTYERRDYWEQQCGSVTPRPPYACTGSETTVTCTCYCPYDRKWCCSNSYRAASCFSDGVCCPPDHNCLWIDGQSRCVPYDTRAPTPAPTTRFTPKPTRTPLACKRKAIGFPTGGIPLSSGYWSGTFRLEKSAGLTLVGLTAGKPGSPRRVVAQTVDTPFLLVKTSSQKAKAAKVLLGASSGPRSKLVALSVKGTRGPNPLVVATYEVDKLGGSSMGCLTVTHRFAFGNSRGAINTGTVEEPVNGCNPLQGGIVLGVLGRFQCAALAASVSYSFKAAAGYPEKLVSVEAVNRYWFRPDGNSIRSTGVFKDCSRTSVPCPKAPLKIRIGPFKHDIDLVKDFCPFNWSVRDGVIRGVKAGATSVKLGQPVAGILAVAAGGLAGARATELRSWFGDTCKKKDGPPISALVFQDYISPTPRRFHGTGIIKGGQGQWDNIHVSSSRCPITAPENPIYSNTGCPECVHMHWRWGEVTNWVQTVDNILDASSGAATCLQTLFRDSKGRQQPLQAIAALLSRPRPAASLALKVALCVPFLYKKSKFTRGTPVRPPKSLQDLFFARAPADSQDPFRRRYGSSAADAIWLSARSVAQADTFFVHPFFVRADHDPSSPCVDILDGA